MTSTPHDRAVHRWLQGLFLLCGLGLLVAVLAMPPSEGLPASEAPSGLLLDPQSVSRPAPHFSLSGRDAKTRSLSDLAGRFVLLNFWATWCEPCKDELPHLSRLARLLAGRPIQLVLVSVDEGWQPVDQLAGEFEKAAREGKRAELFQDTADLLRGKLPNVIHLLDPGQTVPKRYGTSKYPETYLIDPRGTIRWWFIGPKAWSHPQAVQFIHTAVETASAG